jgi:hypothetical protein
MTKNRTVDQAVERLAQKYGISPDELIKALDKVTTPEFGAHPEDTEKYGRMLHVKSSLVRPFYLSRNKARTIVAVFDTIKAWANGELK